MHLKALHTDSRIDVASDHQMVPWVLDPIHFNNLFCCSEKKEESNLFFTSLNREQSKADVWFLNSGCSNHMFGWKEIFQKIDDSIKL